MRGWENGRCTNYATPFLPDIYGLCSFSTLVTVSPPSDVGPPAARTELANSI